MTGASRGCGGRGSVAKRQIWPERFEGCKDEHDIDRAGAPCLRASGFTQPSISLSDPLRARFRRAGALRHVCTLVTGRPSPALPRHDQGLSSSRGCSRLARCDRDREIALVAVDDSEGAAAPGEIVGVAHLIEEPAEPGCAEFDILVRTDVKGHGVGFQLMKDVLAPGARAPADEDRRLYRRREPRHAADDERARFRARPCRDGHRSCYGDAVVRCGRQATAQAAERRPKLQDPSPHRLFGRRALSIAARRA